MLTTADLRRASGPALRAYFSVATQWGLGGAQACALLGNPDSARWRLWQQPDPPVVDEATLLRIRYVLGIAGSLDRLLGRTEEVRQWLRHPNMAPTFSGAVPITRMTTGSLIALRDVCAYLEGQFEWG